MAETVTEEPAVEQEPKEQEQREQTPPVETERSTAEQDAAMARMRRDLEAANRRAEQAETREKERERKEAEARGEFEQIAREQTERAEALDAEKRRERAEANAERSARDLKFKDPGYALYLLQQDGVDLADPAAVRTGLTALADARRDMVGVAPPPPSGGPAGGEKSEPPPLTRARVEQMTAQELAKYDPEVVRRAVAET